MASESSQVHVLRSHESLPKGTFILTPMKSNGKVVISTIYTNIYSEYGLFPIKMLKDFEMQFWSAIVLYSENSS